MIPLFTSRYLSLHQSSSKTKQLVLLFKANSFLPSTIPEFANLKPQTEWDGMIGFVVPKTRATIIRGKAQSGIFDGLSAASVRFPQDYQSHPGEHMGRYSTDDNLLTALRGTEIFWAYLEVVEFQPKAISRSSTGGSTLNLLSSQDTANTTDDGKHNTDMRLFPFPAPIAVNSTSYTTVVRGNPTLPIPNSKAATPRNLNIPSSLHAPRSPSNST